MLAVPVPLTKLIPGDVASTDIPIPGDDCAAVPDPLAVSVSVVPVSTVIIDPATLVVPSSALDPDRFTTFCVISASTFPLML